VNTDRLWKILDAIQAQIRAFDTKAQIVIGINGILAGFFGANAGKLGESLSHASPTRTSCFLIASAFLTLLFMLTSIIIAVFTIHPRLHLNQPNSHLFFAHIFCEFGNDYERMRQSFSCITEPDHRADLENQILAVSRICCKKAQLFKFALFTMAFGLGLWVVTLGLQFRVAQYVPPSPGTATCCPHRVAD
jgi:hypothetical protein